MYENGNEILLLSSSFFFFGAVVYNSNLSRDFYQLKDNDGRNEKDVCVCVCRFPYWIWGCVIWSVNIESCWKVPFEELKGVCVGRERFFFFGTLVMGRFVRNSQKKFLIVKNDSRSIYESWKVPALKFHIFNSKNSPPSNKFRSFPEIHLIYDIFHDIQYS